MKKTAIEWLIERLNLDETSPNYNNLTIEKAKAMEKEQIIRTHLMARCYDNQNSFTEAEQYYNETFKSE